MHPHNNQRPSGPWDQFNAMRNPGENNFHAWGMSNMPGQVMHSAPPPGNFERQPPNNFCPQDFNQAFRPPPMFCPPPSGAPFFPPPIVPSAVNVNAASIGTMPPPPVFHEQPAYPLDPCKDTVTASLQSKSAGGWLKGKLLRQPADSRNHEEKFQIHEYRMQLEKCVRNTKELDKLSSAAKENLENLSDQEWTEMCHKIQQLKKLIATNLEHVSNTRVLASIKKQLEKRQKKRARLKRRNIEFREERVKKENDRKIRNQQIDDWMRMQAEKAANVKRDEQLKKEAQVVLSEVTRRTTEANRQLELLSGLEKLRQLKSQLPHNKQETETIDSLTVLDNLKKMWSAKLKEYELEEQGLKLMLSEANMETMKSKRNVEKEAMNKWKDILFGQGDSHQFYNDFNELLLIRNQWDKFAMPYDSNAVQSQVSSLIPIGWVLPSGPNSPAWKKFTPSQ